MGGGAADGTDSDLTVPLLRKDSDVKVASPRESLHTGEDLEAARTVGDGVLNTKNSEPSDLAAGQRDGLDDEAKVSGLSHEEETGSSFLQATLNGTNILVGVAILSTPYAISQGGWLSLTFLLTFAMVCLYTGILLRRCLDTDSQITTFPDIGQAAFGRTGRLVVSFLLYFELYCVTVEFLILEGDNLTSLFPFSGATIGNFNFTQQQVFIVLSALCIFPTFCVRELSLLSYISAGGVVASMVVVLAVGYVGAFDGVGFHRSGTFFNVTGLPVALGVYGFCFSGHAVFPSIYNSMKHRQDFSKVLVVCFVVVTTIYAGIGVLGYTMFGDEVESQVTLSLPSDYLSSRIAIWTTLVNPFAKFAISLNPVAVALEEFLPWTPKSRQYFIWSRVIRFGLMASIVVVALFVPFFAYMMAFIGSFMSITVSIILPCLCYLRIFGRGRVSPGEFSVLVVILFVGVMTAIVGTYSAIEGIASQVDSN